MQWITGSITAESKTHPSFRIFELDAEELVPTKIEKHFFNLTKANDENKPEWTFHNEYTAEYGLKDLSPSTILDLATRLKTDEKLAV